MSRIHYPLAALLICVSFLYAPSIKAGECNSLDELGWLMGRWESRTEKSVASERWTRVSENTAEVVGQTFALPDFKQTFLETIRVVVLSGDIYFIAKVSHNEYPIPFRLTDCSQNLAVFEKPDHDFPTRIAYNLVHAGQLRVDVSDARENGFSVHFVEADKDRRIALTFDDAPRSDSQYLSGTERTRLLIENLAAAKSPPVIFFSIARGIDQQGDARMRAYQEAGHFVGNHTFSHQRISSMGVEAYAADIRKAHEILSQYENFVPLFRFPFLDEGRDVKTRDRLREVLRELGYQNGYVTVDNYDFFMDSLLQRAVKQGREINMDQLSSAYVGSLMESVRSAADLAGRTLGRQPAHSLLLHENDLAALFIGDLIRALRFEGWQIIDARKAYEDPIAEEIPDTLFNNQGRVAAIARANGAEARELVHRAEDTVFLEQYFEDHDAFGEPKPWMPGDSDLLFSSNRDGNSEIYLLPAGQEEWVNLSNHPASDNYPVWSPDGSKIAFQSRRNGMLDVFTMDADGSDLLQLTDHPEHDYLPSWTQDGEQITFASWRSEADEEPGKNHIYIMNADGSDKRRLMEESPGTSASVQWSPDGGHMIRTMKTGDEGSNLFLADAEGTVLKQLTDDTHFNGAPAFSPDGSKIAFYSDNEGKVELVVMNADGSERRSVVTYGQSYYPHWSPDGCWLIFTASAVPDESHDFVIRAIRAEGYSDWVTLVSAGSRESEGSWRPGHEKPDLNCH